MSAETHERNYHVVFEGVGGENSNHPGIRTWTSFENAEDLKRFMEESKNRDAIIAAGISQEEAIELTKGTSPVARLGAAFSQATKPDGSVSMELLKYYLTNAAMAIYNDRQTDDPDTEVKDITPPDQPPELP